MSRNEIWKHSSEEPDYGAVIISLGECPMDALIGTYGCDLLFDEETDCQWCYLRDIVPENYNYTKEQWWITKDISHI